MKKNGGWRRKKITTEVTEVKKVTEEGGKNKAFAAKDRKDRKAESTPLEGIRPFCASLRPICCAASLFLLTAPDENEAVWCL